MNLVAKRLEELGIVLPRPAAPAANYVPAVRAGALLVVSGQLPFGPDGKLAPAHLGKLTPGSAIEPAIAILPVRNQLIAKVSSVPRARQLTALRTDLVCVSAPRKSVTRCLPARPPRSTITRRPPLRFPRGVTIPVMDLMFRSSAKAIDLTNQS